MADTPKLGSEQKVAEEKLIIKERIKDKLEKLEVKEKPEKHEVKEKPEKFEHKEKPEKIEHKEKPEKHEFKEKDFEKYLKEYRIEKPEIDTSIPQIPIDPGGPVEQRVAALEQAFNHFIASGQRPDVSRGALAAERDTKK
jgi:hypothetical protein